MCLFTFPLLCFDFYKHLFVNGPRRGKIVPYAKAKLILVMQKKESLGVLNGLEKDTLNIICE